MKNKFKFKVGSALTSLAVVIGFVALLIFVVNPGIDGNRLGAQAGKGGDKGGSVTVPGAPTLGSATAGDGEVSLAWTAPKSNGGAAVTAYSVSYEDSSRSATTVNTKSTSTSYTVTGLTNGERYSFTVAAINSAGTGAYSSAQTATPVSSVTVPDVPADLSATAGDGEVSLAWTAPADGGADITDYSVVYTDGITSVTVSTRSTSTSYTVTGLTNDTEYTFKVFATNSEGDGSQSSGVTATPEAEVSGPGAPKLISATAGDGSIVVKWSAPGDTGGSDITGYTVSYTPERGSESTVDAGLVTTYSLTGLTNGTEYTIKVRASNADADGSYSSTKTATPMTTPGAPTGLSITPGDGTLALSWTAPDDNGGASITDYTISYTKAGGSEQTVSVGSASTSYTLEGLSNGSNYSVKVLAVNAEGNSSYTTASTSAPDAAVAPAIVGVPSVTVADNSAVVAWSTNKKVSSKVDFGFLETTASTPEYNKEERVLNHSVTVTSLLPCTTYSYRVKSYDASSQEVTSSKESFTTTGCSTTAAVRDIEQDTVDTTVGGELDFTSTDVKTKLRVPANLKSGATDVVFQVKKLEKNTTAEDIGKPDGVAQWLGDHAYNLSAYGSESEEVNDFDNPLDVTIEYSREDVSGIDLDTLKIHHYDEETGWTILNECENVYDSGTGKGEITCKTSKFSIFGLFGEGVANSSSSGSYTASAHSSSSSTDDDEMDTLNTDVSDDLVISEEIANNEAESEDQDMSNENVESPASNYMFNQDLWMGSNNADVFELQKFLNLNGFILAQDGPGSPGRETSYFGERTFNALKSFQSNYSQNILTPAGLANPTGYFGVLTRTFINQNF